MRFRVCTLTHATLRLRPLVSQVGLFPKNPAGRMMMQIIGTFAEFERAMLRERTQSGLETARAQGRVGGRRPKLKANQQKEIVNLVGSGKKSAADAARLFNVHPATVSRLLQRSGKSP